SIAQATLPANAVSALGFRTWNDSNGNYVPDCDLRNNAANEECGALSNSTFGTRLITTQYTNDAKRGWGHRPSVWMVGASVEHELRPGVGVSAGYFSTRRENLVVTANTLTGPADYTSFCVTAPVDPRLPGGGGYPICDLYDVSSSLFGRVNNVLTR